MHGFVCVTAESPARGGSYRELKLKLQVLPFFLALAVILLAEQGKVLLKQCLGLKDGGKAAGTGRLLPPVPHFPLEVTSGMATVQERKLKTLRS